MFLNLSNFNSALVEHHSVNLNEVIVSDYSFENPERLLSPQLV